MLLQTGSIIQSTPLLHNSYFENSSIIITECNAQGAVGFILHRLFPRTLNELVEFQQAASIDLYIGGPVCDEQIYFLHTVPELGGTPVTSTVFYGGDFTKAVALLSSGQLSHAQVKIFLGYCGWDTGDLEAEIAEGSWTITEITSAALFT